MSLTARGVALAAVAAFAWLGWWSQTVADPAAIPAPDLKAGDAWVYDGVVEQGASGYAETHWAVQVEEVRDGAAIIGIKRQGAPTAFQDHEFGRDWSEHLLAEGQPIVGERPYDFPLNIGKSWVVDYDDPVRHGLQTSTHVHKTFKVVGWEDVVTPAGHFHALRIEGRGTLKAQIASSTGGVSGMASSPGDTTAVIHAQSTPSHTEYATTYGVTDYAPEVKSFVKSVHETYNASGVRIRRETRILESYKPAA